jgi:hypothetical protein
MPLHRLSHREYTLFTHDPATWEVYFTDMSVPTDDSEAYEANPLHRWVYNKMLVCESQDMHCAPHGLKPDSFPVFSKPVYNLMGMGAGSMAINNESEYYENITPGHFWCPLLTGPHVSTDVAMVDGVVMWHANATATPGCGGTFDMWTLDTSDIDTSVRDWLEENLRGYTGVANVEHIGGKIIECHLRAADQWPDLYGQNWSDALKRIYADGTWSETERTSGYSVVLFGEHGRHYTHPDYEIIEKAMAEHQLVSSIQITFPDAPLSQSNPPGGFRLAVVNGTDVEQCRQVRQVLTNTLLSNI